MKDFHINILFSDEDDGYIADIRDLDACSDSEPLPKKRWPRWSGRRRRGSQQHAMQGKRFPSRATVQSSIRRVSTYSPSGAALFRS